jgi:flagellin-like hook-associated protein FlgL
MVSLQEAVTNGNTTAVNTQSSESAIRDTDVGAETTAFTRDQILSSFQSKLVASTERMSAIVATLVADSIVR